MKCGSALVSVISSFVGLLILCTFGDPVLLVLCRGLGVTLAVGRFIYYNYSLTPSLPQHVKFRAERVMHARTWKQYLFRS